MFVWAHIWFDFDQSQGVEAFVEGGETVLAAAQGSWASQSASFALFLKFFVHDFFSAYNDLRSRPAAPPPVEHWSEEEEEEDDEA